MASALESALELIELVYLKDGLKVVGVYDAPLKVKNDDAVPITSLALTIAEQIKSHNDTLDVIVLSIRVP